MTLIFEHVLDGVGVVLDYFGFHYVDGVAFPFQDAAQSPGHGEVRFGQFPDVAGIGVLIDAGDHLVAVLVGDVDGNGVVNVADHVELSKIIMNKEQ